MGTLGFRCCPACIGRTLGRPIHAQPELVVPALMRDFRSTDTLLRSLILTSLAQFEGKARESVPMVVEALKDTDQNVSNAAAFALKEIDPEAATKAGVK